jgi:hypothetical protein
VFVRAMLACGRASRMWRPKPSMKSYWLRWASSARTTMTFEPQDLSAEPSLRGASCQGVECRFHDLEVIASSGVVKPHPA